MTDLTLLSSDLGRIHDFANALDFDGASGTKMQIGTATYGFERTDAFSWGFWMYPRLAATTSQILVGEFAASPFEGWHSRLQNGYLRGWLVGAGGTGASLRNDYTPPPLNQWTYVEFTYDGSSTAAGLKCRYNKVLQTAQVTMDLLATSLIVPDAQMVWGNFGPTGSPGFDGLLIPAGIWDYERTQSQIDDYFDKAIYSGTAPLDTYRLDENSGNTVVSYGSAGNDGTLSGVTWESSNVPRNGLSFLSQDLLPLS